MPFYSNYITSEIKKNNNLLIYLNLKPYNLKIFKDTRKIALCPYFIVVYFYLTYSNPSKI